MEGKESPARGLPKKKGPRQRAHTVGARPTTHLLSPSLFSLFPPSLPGDDDVPAGGIVTGLGRIHGRLVALAANDATVKGGTCVG